MFIKYDKMYKPTIIDDLPEPYLTFRKANPAVLFRRDEPITIETLKMKNIIDSDFDTLMNDVMSTTEQMRRRGYILECIDSDGMGYFSKKMENVEMNRCLNIKPYSKPTTEIEGYIRNDHLMTLAIHNRLINDTYGMYVNENKKGAKSMNANELLKDMCMFNIKDVIFNPPATVVYWTDHSKTVVKCGGNDVYDPEKGLAMAILKKLWGNTGAYYKVFKPYEKDFERFVNPDPKEYSILDRGVNKSLLNDMPDTTIHDIVASLLIDILKNSRLQYLDSVIKYNGRLDYHLNTECIEFYFEMSKNIPGYADSLKLSLIVPTCTSSTRDDVISRMSDLIQQATDGKSNVWMGWSPVIKESADNWDIIKIDDSIIKYLATRILKYYESI